LRGRRLLLVIPAVIGLAAIAVGIVSWRLIVDPRTDTVTIVDAVVVLSGDHGERLPVARRIIADGLTDVLVYAGTSDGPRTEELCEQPQAFTVYCPRPVPDSTRAEARAVASLARRHGWRSIAVITSTPHVTRARMLFRRCFDGEVRVFGEAPLITSAEKREQIREEVQKLLYTAIARRC
jgi:uncharacterized SAM-binding protein YcdF (DUF218 family)